MGSMSMPAGMLFGSLSDFVGAKSGVALTRVDIDRLLEKHDGAIGYNDYTDDRMVRMESVVYDEMVETLLFALGRLEKRQNFLPMAELLHKYGRTGPNAKLATEIGRRFVEFTKAALASEETKSTKSIDPSPFMRQCWETHGKLGLEMAMICVESLNVWLMLRGSLFPDMKKVTKAIALKDLFSSEGLEAQFGEFFDQRYIDYLHRNFDDIDSMNWRKFEGLTAEYFVKLGFTVELGPGRNDDGIDVRVWPKDSSQEKPLSMIIQSKRERRVSRKESSRLCMQMSCTRKPTVACW